MGNRRLYREDVYMKTAESRVLEARPVCDAEGGYTDESELLLEDCIFFPPGGGQSCDLGSVAGFPLTAVFEEGENVWCRLRGAFAVIKELAGKRVSCELDWERRFDNMQRHDGEHILSGMFFREYGAVNRGFHMGEDYMTVDLSMEDPRFPVLTHEMALHAELCANEAIWQDLPVTTLRFKNREEAAAAGIPMRKELPDDIEGEVSIVCVGSLENAADSVFCCGTHPSSAGQVGLIKIYKVEKYKKLFRVYCEAGKRALLNYDRKLDILTEIAKKYSTRPEDLSERLEKAEARSRDKIKELKAALRESASRNEGEKNE